MTKKLFFIAILIGSISQKIEAQVESFEIGFKFGLNVADILGDETDELDPRTSVHLGLVAEIPIIEVLAIQPELFYSFQGYKGESAEPNFEDENLKLDYIYLPVMVKYYPFYTAPGFSIEVGPQVGYLVSATLERKNTANGGTETSDLDFKEFISDIDYGLNAGLGYQFEFGTFVQARYYFGISDIVDLDIEDAFSRRNGVFQFSAGYKF
ncbi:PorT family protein [Aquimarina sp. D1M17]|uniref:porin family protein n=1 Tax=Aquimarina acroporae TaxID=2937283 RepID=UPI0020BE1281|nr:porin family protein [Aquimarina acroporae]MCK8520617.1 PorT family protein [Aquimarina acroporae]